MNGTGLRFNNYIFNANTFDYSVLEAQTLRYFKKHFSVLFLSQCATYFTRSLFPNKRSLKNFLTNIVIS